MVKRVSEKVTVTVAEIVPIEPKRVVLTGKGRAPKRQEMEERAESPFDRPTGQFKAIKDRGEATSVEEVLE